MFLEASAKTSYNVEESFLETSRIIYENISRGVYDLSNEKSGIRVGNDASVLTDERGGKLKPGGGKGGGKKKESCC